jgi:hypothetical protein
MCSRFGSVRADLSLLAGDQWRPTVRNIPDSFDPAVVSEIDQELTAVAGDHGVAAVQ